MNRHGDYLLWANAEEIRRQATLRLAKLIVIGITAGLVLAWVIEVSK